jgi:hypothetical protein
MNTISESRPTHKFILGHHGSGGNRVWWHNETFLYVIDEVLCRGAKCQSDLFIFCPQTGKNVFLTIAEQRAHNKICKGNLPASLDYMQSIAKILGVPWNDTHNSFIEWKLKGKAWEYLSHWKEQHNGQVYSDSVGDIPSPVSAGS